MLRFVDKGDTEIATFFLVRLRSDGGNLGVSLPASGSGPEAQKLRLEVLSVQPLCFPDFPFLASFAKLNSSGYSCMAKSRFVSPT